MQHGIHLNSSFQAKRNSYLQQKIFYCNLANLGTALINMHLKVVYLDNILTMSKKFYNILSVIGVT
jgi:hypothetical protein